MSGFNYQNESKNPLWIQADEIYRRWNAEEFDIDPDKGVNLKYTFTVEDPDDEENRRGILGGTKKREESTGTLLDFFTARISDWSAKRQLSGRWIISARKLIQVYNVARAHQALIPGLTVKRELGERERQIAQIDAERREATKRSDMFEKRFRKTYDALIDVHNKLTEREKELSDIRGKDIRSSLDNNTSGVLQGKFGDDDDAK